MPSECAAVGCSEKLTKKFSVHAFPLKKEEEWSQKTTVANGNESMGPSHKEMGTQKPRSMCSAQSISKKMLHRSHTAEHSVWAQIHDHTVTDLDKFPVRISKDEAPTPLPVVGPLFISPFVVPSFSSLVRCVAFRSFLLFTLAFTTG